VGGAKHRGALAIALLVLAFQGGRLLAQATDGKLAPAIVLDGALAEGACAFVATGTEHTFESATGSAIDVPAGTYELRVECKVDDDPLVPGSVQVQIAPGKTVSPRIEVRTARLRVEARRNGIMLPAKVKMYPAGRSTEAKPLAELRANQKAVVAQGRYDVVVELEDPRSPHAEALFEKTQVGGGPLTVLQADLSDGGLVVSATSNGKKASALVRVLPWKGGPKDIATQDAGEEVRLPAGRYWASTELRDTADFATKKREMWIHAGKVLRVAEAFETGDLSVTVERDQKPIEATVRISLPNAGDFFNHFSAPGTITLSPGVFDVSISSDALGPLKTPLKTVRVQKGQHAKVAFDLTPATLIVKVVKGGKPVDAELHVRAAGGGEELTAPEVSGRFRLWPGRYEIVAKLEEGDEVLDGPFEVKLGDKLTRTVNVVRGTLTVIAMRGKSAESNAEIEIFRPGAAKPLAKGRSGARLEIAPGVYDIKIRSGTEVTWKEGVKLKREQVVQIDLPPMKGSKEEPLPEGDLSAPSDDLPEGEEPAAKELRPDAGPRDGGPKDSGPKDGGPKGGTRDAQPARDGSLPPSDAGRLRPTPDGSVAEAGLPPTFPDAGVFDAAPTPLKSKG
jgi:hypothetical protein